MIEKTPFASEATFSFHGDHQDDLVLGHHQDIPCSYLDQLRDERMTSASRRMGDTVRIASIPEVVVVKWLHQGFNIWQASAKEIVAKLRSEDLGAFLTTNKRI